MHSPAEHELLRQQLEEAAEAAAKLLASDPRGSQGEAQLEACIQVRPAACSPWPRTKRFGASEGVLLCGGGGEQCVCVLGAGWVGGGGRLRAGAGWVGQWSCGEWQPTARAHFLVWLLLN